MIVGTQSPAERYGWPGRCAQCSRSRAHGLEHDRHLLDRVDRAALLRRQLVDAGVPGAAADRDARQQAAAAGDPDDEPARLRHDRGVGLQRAGCEEPAGAGRLLLGDGVDDQVAGERHAELGERAGGDDHARDAALHVARAAPVEQPVAHVGDERVGLRPVAARLGVDDVDVAVEQQRPPAAAAAEARDELRPAVERRGRRAPSDAAAARRRRARAARPPRRGGGAARPGAPAARAPRAARAPAVCVTVSKAISSLVSATSASRRAAIASTTRCSVGESGIAATVARVSVSFAGHELHSPRFALRGRPRAGPASASASTASVSELGSHQDQNVLVDTGAGALRPQDRQRGLRRGRARPPEPRHGPPRRAPAARGAAAVCGARRQRDRRGRARRRDLPAAARHVHRGRAAARRSRISRRAVLRALGEAAGLVARALEGFEHPAADRAMQWDPRHVGAVVEALAAHVEDPRRRALAVGVAEAAAEAIERLAPRLPRQIIHCDVTDWNVIGRRDRAGLLMPCGVIDFGDVTRTLRVCELAVAASIAYGHDPDEPICAAAEIVRGFDARVPARRRRARGAPAPDRGARRDRRRRHRAAGGARAAQRLRPARARGRLGDLRGRGEGARRCSPRRPSGSSAAVSAARLARARAGRASGRCPACSPAAAIDLSPGSDALADGAWRSPGALAALAPRGRARRPRRGAPLRDARALARRARDDPPRARPLRARAAARCARRSRAASSAAASASSCSRSPTPRVRLAGLVPAVAAGDERRRGRAARRRSRRPRGSCRRTCTCRSRRPACGRARARARRRSPPPGSRSARIPGRCSASPRRERAGEDVARSPPRGDPARRSRSTTPSRPRWCAGCASTSTTLDARAYLDCVNNVASIGHSHPRVTAAAVAAAAPAEHQLALPLREHDALRRAPRGAAARAARARLPRLDGLRGQRSRAAPRARGDGPARPALRPRRLPRLDDRDLRGLDELRRQPARRQAQPPWVHPVLSPDTYRGPFGAGEPDAGARYADVGARRDRRARGRRAGRRRRSSARRSTATPAASCCRTATWRPPTRTCARRAASASPTRCRSATGASARISGASSSRASCPTSSRSRRRPATGIRSRP